MLLFKFTKTISDTIEEMPTTYITLLTLYICSFLDVKPVSLWLLDGTKHVSYFKMSLTNNKITIDNIEH